MKKIIERQKDIIDDVLYHFHPESSCYGGWELRYSNEDPAVKIIKREFKGILSIKKQGPTYVVKKIQKRRFKPIHTIKILTEERNLYREEAHKLRDGLHTLLGE